MRTQSNEYNIGATRDIPVPVKICLDLLSAAGFEAWLVGGCVRDFLMGRVPKDYDVTTSAKTDEMRLVFSEYKVIDSGGIYGTLTIIVDDFDIEVTTFRTESGYEDSRHPSNVTFVRSLSEDLVRRDFTVNALAMDSQGHLADEVGGLNDIRARIIRTVGDAGDRFSEDPLRILRALRFAAELEFDIDEATVFAMKSMQNRLSAISSERVHTENRRLFCATGVTRALLLGQDILLNMFSIRELLASYRYPDEEIVRKAWHRTAKAVGSVRNDFAVRLSVFSLMADYYIEFLDASNYTTTDRCEAEKLRLSFTKNILNILKCGKNVKSRALSYSKIMSMDWAGDDCYFRTLMNQVGEDVLLECIEISRDLAEGDVLPCHDGGTVRGEIARVRKAVDRILENGDCWSLSCLAVGGEDIKKMGVTRGKMVGDILTLCLQRVIKDPNENRKDKLVDFAKNQIELMNRT